MADAEARIDIDINASKALAQIKDLQRQISGFHSEMAKGSAKAQAAAASLQKDLINNINATKAFTASITKVQTSAESFTTALEKNKLSLREYFRYGVAASGKFAGKFNAELETINKTARERVKDIQSQYIELGRDANGVMRAIKIRPQILDLENYGTKAQLAAQKQQIFNQLLTQGSTNLLNFGKNTQWAGRQLMVGFTIPLTIFGTKAASTFMDLEKQAIKFRRVYGDLFTPPEETQQTLAALQDLSLEFTKYGVAVSDTMALASEAAAMGQVGAGLMAQVSEATRLSVLGSIEQSKALETTISVTNAFGIAAEDLASKIDFLNAVENQTVTSIDDLTTAIPKAAPVIKQLGGNVEDLAFFLTAMKEGGINASEGANALKSGLASMINPTGKAAEMLQGFGINLKGIVDANKGDVKGMVIGLAQALDTLDPTNRARAIEELFGKFQFARISTLFQNVIAEGTQAQRVLELTNATAQELAGLSQKELGAVAESTTYKFQAAIERLKTAIAPIGEQFLKAVTPLIEGASKILDQFNNLNDGVKNFVVIGGALLAGLGPVFLMTFGLVANGVANIIKGFIAVRGWFQKTKDSSTVLGEQLTYMSQEQINAAAAAASLERTHATLEQRFTSELSAINKLISAYQRAARAQGAFPAGAAAAKTKVVKAATGGKISGPGTGTSDSIPAMLSDGEYVIPAKQSKKYAPLLNGIIADNIPGFKVGRGTPEKGISVEAQMKRDYTALYGAEEGAKILAAAERVLAAEIAAIAAAMRSNPLMAADSVKSQTMLHREHMVNVDKNIQDPRLWQIGTMARPGTNVANNLVQTISSSPKNLESIKVYLEKAGASAKEIEAISAKLKNGVSLIGEEEQKFGKALQLINKDLISGKATMGRKKGDAFTPGMRFSGAVGKSIEARYKTLAKEDPAVASKVQGNQKAAQKKADMIAAEYNAAKQENVKATKKNTKQVEQATVEEKKAANAVSARSAAAKKGWETRRANAGAAPAATAPVEKSMSNLSSKVMNASMAFSSVTMMMGMFGQDIGPAGEAVFQLSNALFALSAITQLVNTEKLKEFAIQKAGMTKDVLSNIFTGGFKNSIKNVGGIFKNLFSATNKLLGKFGGLIPYVGIAIAVFEGFKLINDIQEQAKARIQAMGDSAFLAGEKLQTIADIIGFSPTRDPGAAGAAIQSTAAGVTGAEAQQGVAIGASEAFKTATEEGGQFYDVIQQLKTMSPNEVGVNLTSLMNEMIALAPEDVDVSKIKGTMLAIAEAAGKTGITLGPALLPNANSSEFIAGVDSVIKGIQDQASKTGAGFTAAASTTSVVGGVSAEDAARAASAAYTGDVASQASQVSSVMESLKTALTAGTISMDQFKLKTTQAMAPILNLPTDLKNSGLGEMMNNLGIPQTVIDSLTTTEGKVQAIKLAQVADISGDTVSQELLKVVDAGHAIGATSEDVRNANIAGKKLASIYDKASVAISKAAVGLEETATAVDYSDLQSQAAAYAELDANAEKLVGVSSTLSGYAMSEAQARALLTDEVWKEKFAQAALLDEQQGTTVNTQQLIKEYQNYQNALAAGNLDQEIAKAKEQNQVYDWLVQNGYTAADAVKVIGDQTLYASAAAAYGAGTFDDFKAKVEELTSLQSSIPTTVSGGGGTQTTPYQDAINQLKDQRKEIINNANAYNKLRSAGMGITDAFNAAKDPVLAAALAAAEVDSDEWNKLYSQIVGVNAVMQKEGINNLIRMQAGDIQFKSDFAEIAPLLSNMGLSAEQISTILSDPNLAKKFISDLKDGKLNAKDLKNYIQQIKTLESIDLQIRLSTPEGILDELGTQMGKINNAFSALEKQVDLDFLNGTNNSGKNTGLLNISKLEADVEKYQGEIDTLQSSVDDYQYYLDSMQSDEDAINKTYDDRQTALDNIAKLNEDIASAQKSQLSVADALAKGDIAAAATAMQERQAQQAEDAKTKQQEALDAGRQSALDRLTAKNGMTRKELEENIADLKQQINDKTHDYLVPAQEALDNAESLRDAAKDTLTYLGQTKAQWEAQENATTVAITSAEAYKTKIQEIIDKIKEAQTEFGKIGSGGGGDSDVVVPPVVDDTDTKGKVVKKVNPAYTTAKTAVDNAQKKVDSLSSQLASVKSTIDSLKKQISALSGVSGMGSVVTTLKNSLSGKNYEYGMVGKSLDSAKTALSAAKTTLSKTPQYLAKGGFVAKGADTVPAMLTPGEFVVKKFAVQNFGADRLKAINSGTYNGESVYNYSVNVNVKSDANADEIARSVMTQIKQIDSQRIRSNRY